MEGPIGQWCLYFVLWAIFICVLKRQKLLPGHLILKAENLILKIILNALFDTKASSFPRRHWQTFPGVSCMLVRSMSSPLLRFKFSYFLTNENIPFIPSNKCQRQKFPIKPESSRSLIGDRLIGKIYSHFEDFYVSQHLTRSSHIGPCVGVQVDKFVIEIVKMLRFSSENVDNDSWWEWINWTHFSDAGKYFSWLWKSMRLKITFFMSEIFFLPSIPFEDYFMRSSDDFSNVRNR